MTFAFNLDCDKFDIPKYSCQGAGRSCWKMALLILAIYPEAQLNQLNWQEECYVNNLIADIGTNIVTTNILTV